MVYEAIPHKIVQQLRFGLFSPQELRRLSAVAVQTADTYDEDGAPISSGLMDGRLGTLEPRQRCRTCGNTAIRCPGHFGHIELAVPIIHIIFTKIIHDLLRATCRNCGRITLPEEQVVKIRERIQRIRKLLGEVPDKIYKKILKDARTKECPYCGAPQHKTVFEKPTRFLEEAPEGGGAHQLTPSMVRERLERVSLEDLELFGYSAKAARPEWMVLQVLPVPPVYVRPSITLNSGIRSEDDLTHKLVDIIRINQRLKENMEAGAPTLIIQDLSELLQYHVTTYFNNEASGIPPARHRSGRALKTLSQRLKGKEGRFRSNLSGKRVDFSARTVISPDPNLDISEVGVPLAIASKLTIPVKVTDWNIEKLQARVRNGPDQYPGALYVLRPDGKRIRLEFVIDREKIAEAIEPGFIVERHLENGDIAIFNRQPSLHRMSIMAHFVKVLPYKTFRLHLCVCPPYNADFDGDEMNLHIPQSEEARTEALLLMQVQDQILSPRFGGPIIGAIRDFITSAYLLTRKSTLLPKRDVCRLLTSASYSGTLPKPQVIKPEPLWSGKQIFSLFLPTDFSYSLKATICQSCTKCQKEECPHDAYVVIKDGILRTGVIDRRAIGAEQSESILHRIIKDYGAQRGREFLNKICQLLKLFISMQGFTYSFDELELSPKAQRSIQKTLAKHENNVQELIVAYRKGTLQRLPGQSLQESFEIYVMNELAKARDVAGQIADRYFSLENSGVLMTRTGARGSSLNIGQMTASVGQQSVRGKRIMRGYVQRALPHFEPDDPLPKARGFVYASYQSGLDPLEYFFHAMGGREGLVDTAVRTQQSGYMQRRLINALEHLRIEYDGTVRNSVGEIVQFRYGEDGVDPAKSDHGKAVNIRRLVDQVTIMVEGKGRPAAEAYIMKKLENVRRQLTPLLIQELRRELTRAKLSRKGIDLTVELTLKHYRQALVEPGEAVGIVAAQSIGEPGTQMTLRTFHYAGVKEQNVTLGLPRLIEIVDARRIPSTPIMSIYLDRKHRRTQEKAKEVAQNILHTTTADIAEAAYIDPESERIIIIPDKRLMKNREISMETLKEKLQLTDCELKTSGKRLLIELLKEKNIKKLLVKILKISIKGASGVSRVLVTAEAGQWVIRTDGSNLPPILETKGIDPTKTISNHVHEIAKTLGIEAARNLLVKEAIGVLEEQGLDVDIRHIMLVSDIMTLTGEVQQIGRHGISGKKSSVLARAAFEITVPNIVAAAVKGETDPLRGVTENVIVGQSIPIGTGLVNLYMDTLAQQEAKDG